MNRWEAQMGNRNQNYKDKNKALGKKLEIK